MSKYIRIDKGDGVRVTLTDNGWAGLSLAAGYFASDLSIHRAKLKDLLPYIPRVLSGRGNYTKRGRKKHKHFPPAQIEALVFLMEQMMELRAGIIEAAQANVGNALRELKRLSAVDLLAAIA